MSRLAFSEETSWHSWAELSSKPAKFPHEQFPLEVNISPCFFSLPNLRKPLHCNENGEAGGAVEESNGSRMGKINLKANDMGGHAKYVLH